MTDLDQWALLECGNFHCPPLKGCTEPSLKDSALKGVATSVEAIKPADLENLD